MMEPNSILAGLGERRETTEQRQARMERERELVTQAESDIEAGLGVDWNDVEAWLNELDRDADKPAPELVSVRALRR